MRIIGVTPSIDDKTGRITINQDYLDAVFRAGGFPVLLPLCDDAQRLSALLDRIDGLLLSGGADVDPARYGEERLPLCGSIAPERDAAEFMLCRLAVERNMPVLAICRGLQVLACAFSGALYQDVAAQFGGTVKHPRDDAPRDQVHGVTLTAGSRLRAIAGRAEIRVNSRHHQAVKRLGEGMVCAALAEDGLIEGVEMPDKKFVVGVQWHPESLSNYVPEAQALFNAFVRACGEEA